MAATNQRTPPSAGSGRGARGVLLNTVALTSASFWRIAVSFVTQLLVARLLDVPALGVFTLTLAWLHIGQIATEAGLPAWMVREVAGRPERRRSVYRHVMRLQVLIALLAWLLLVLLAWLLPAWLPPLAVVALAGASLPFYALMSASLALFEASERMPLVLRVDLFANSLLLAGTALFLWLGYGVAVLFGVLAVAQALTALLALWLARRSQLAIGAPTDPTLHWQATLRATVPFFTISFTDVLQQRADLLLLGAFTSPAVTGIYAAATSILRVGVKLAQAYWRALYPTLTRLRGADSFVLLAEFALRIALALAFGAALSGMLASNALVVLLFGAEFAASGAVLAILLWSLPFSVWEARALILLQSARQARHAAQVTLIHLAALALGVTLLVGGIAPLHALSPALAGFDGARGAAVAVLLSAIIGALVAAKYARRHHLPTGITLIVRVGVCAGGALLVGVLAGPVFAYPAGWLPVAVVTLLAYALLLIAARLLRAEDIHHLRRAFAPR